MNTDLWNKMVEETMNYKKPTKEQGWLFDEPIPSSNESVSEVSNELPQGPGVTFLVDASETDICLRLESHDRLEQVQLTGQTPVNYFETTSSELAQVLVDHYHLKRFRGLNLYESGPIEESYLWWLRSKEDHKFELVFGKAGLNNQCLGYLGDESIAIERFLRSEELFSKLGMRLRSQKSNSIEFTARANNNDGYKLFSNLLQNGNGAKEIYEYFGGEMDLTMYFYLNEIATLRKFWLKFCHCLKNLTNKPIIH